MNKKNRTGIAFEKVVETMSRLRSKRGCPWDLEQTHDSIKPYLIEEAYEVIEALDEGDDEKLKEELGDLIFQIVFHAQIAKEEGRFSILDVLKKNFTKMRQRHPHVFGKMNLKTPKAVLANWEKMKIEEKKERKSVLDGIPKNLPSLLWAHRIQDKASRVGFDWNSHENIIEKINEEVNELKSALKSKGIKKKKETEQELGDILFSIVNLARFLRINPDSALKKTIKKFEKRFKNIEIELKKRGKIPEESTLQEMDEIWEKTKKRINT